MPIFDASPLAITALNITLALLQHLGVAWISMHIPLRHFQQDNRYFRTQPWERQGELWQTLFLVRNWKKHLPDGAAWFKNGYSKKNLHNRSPANLERFRSETRRAEFSHGISLLLCPVFFLYNPTWAAWAMVAYSVLANIPCLVVQRYNREKLRIFLIAKSPK